MDKQLYLLLASLNEAIDSCDWPLLDLEWTKCPYCEHTDFQHTDDCSLKQEIADLTEDWKDILVEEHIKVNKGFFNPHKHKN